MKLQREMRDKTNRLQALQAKYSTLEQVYNYVHVNLDHLIHVHC